MNNPVKYAIAHHNKNAILRIDVFYSDNGFKHALIDYINLTYPGVDLNIKMEMELLTLIKHVNKVLNHSDGDKWIVMYEFKLHVNSGYLMNNEEHYFKDDWDGIMQK